jgi:hypothetical protein
VTAGVGAARARPWALAAGLLAAALLLDLGDLHRLQQGDSLLPVLVSLQRWTPFYWDQERFGMLLPLLALPVRDPLWNLLLQHGLMALVGLAAVVLLARHVLGGRDWPLAGALAAGSLLLAAPPAWRFEWLVDQPYGLSLSLALSGLALAEPVEGRRRPARLAAAVLLVLLAHWVNAAAGAVLLPLALAREVADRLEGEPRRALSARLLVDGALLLLGLAVGHLLLRLEPVLDGHPLRLALTLLPPGEWPEAWAAVAARAWREAGAWPAWILGMAGAGLALLARPAHRAELPGALRRAGALLGAALAWFALAGALAWVKENAWHWRYLAPAAVMLHLAAASLLAEPLSRSRRATGPLLAAAVALVPVAALLVSGPPSLARVRADLEGLAGGRGTAALEAGCDLVAGSYWSVWPAVYQAALVAGERAGARPVYGVTHRSNPTLPLWWARRQALRLCLVEGEEPEAERWLRAYRLWPVLEDGRAGPFRLARLP